MSLPPAQQRILDGIADALRASEPRLAAMFAIFTKLTKNDAAPWREQLPARRSIRTWLAWLALLSPRTWLARRKRLARRRRLAQARRPAQGSTATRAGWPTPAYPPLLRTHSHSARPAHSRRRTLSLVLIASQLAVALAVVGIVVASGSGNGSSCGVGVHASAVSRSRASPQCRNTRASHSLSVTGQVVGK